ncbi:DUF309 domain-containing protein [Texcoconibacillus texcoconensis]|uniref:DUF309 domain-containing protein n=1 Tax=Texcoconibacillus texcoconensis TaxID=1095777 RepID=A0A840QNN8_9BACI|nr:DUF309 domain-containing protein [Texcoconibacillus texcoconensis]MBB5172970.1 hypothetical protein [Texcoconibacillus texcoconensis]
MNHYPKPFIEYLTYFHGMRDYFECHEVLEEHWKDVKNQSNRSEDHWVALIQLAVALYHHRQNNYAGAKRLYKNAERLMSDNEQKLQELSINVDELIRRVKAQHQDVTASKAYQPIAIPLEDDDLIDLCKQKCQEEGHSWNENEDHALDDIIYKHKRRDRSDVISERKQALMNRNDRH